MTFYYDYCLSLFFFAGFFFYLCWKESSFNFVSLAYNWICFLFCFVFVFVFVLFVLKLFFIYNAASGHWILCCDPFFFFFFFFFIYWRGDSSVVLCLINIDRNNDILLSYSSLSIYLFIYLSIYLSIYLFIYLSISLSHYMENWRWKCLNSHYCEN